MSTLLGVTAFITYFLSCQVGSRAMAGLQRKPRWPKISFSQEEACATLRRDVGGKGGDPLGALRVRAPG